MVALEEGESECVVWSGIYVSLRGERVVRSVYLNSNGNSLYLLLLRRDLKLGRDLRTGTGASCSTGVGGRRLLVFTTIESVVSLTSTPRASPSRALTSGRPRLTPTNSEVSADGLGCCFSLLARKNRDAVCVSVKIEQQHHTPTFLPHAALNPRIKIRLAFRRRMCSVLILTQRVRVFEEARCWDELVRSSAEGR